MANQIGMNVIGSTDRPSLFAGDFPRVTMERQAGTTDIALGSVVILATDGTLALATTPGDPIHGIAAEDIKAGNIGTVWLTGEFIGPRLVIGGGDWTAYVDTARQKSIFLKDARLAPNQ
jgi:hypothetical protein